MQQVRLILVGGFLGAGKTTLLAQAAGRLIQRGRRVGLVTNDQATDLVDTRILEQCGFNVREVSGGCFCCRFEHLVSIFDRLLEEHRPDVLLGEAVGGCTDLSATVMQPLKADYADRFRVAPFSVLVDPARLREALDPGAGGRLPAGVLYIFRKQLEEADLIVFNKADLASEAERRDLKAAVAERFSPAPMLDISALTGNGVDEWLAAVTRDEPAGRRIAQVDYDTYADGEAALGWLNAAVKLHAARGADWRSFCIDLLGRLRRACRDRSAEIAHVKLFLTSPAGSLAGNLTSTAGAPSVRGTLDPGAPDATLILNARVHLGPDDLRDAVTAALQAAAGDGIARTILRLEHLSPTRPTPRHRYDHVVD